MVGLILLFFSLSLPSAEGKAPPMNPSNFGEKNFEHYFGPVHPEFRKDERYGRIVFEEQKRRAKLFYDSSERELGELEDFLKDFEAARVCPNSLLAKHHEYIRYLFRLSALSYLSESLELMDETSRKMKFGEVCKTDFKQLLEQCSPQGEDMKLFVKSARVLSKNFEDPSVPYDFPFEKFSKDWRSNFSSGKAKGPVQKRLSFHCQASGKGCKKLSQKTLKSAFTRICRNDAKKFVKICSEKDHLHGMARVQEPFHIIGSSEALKVINEEGHGRGCLARYSSLMKDREVRDMDLEGVFPALFEKLKLRGPLSHTGGKLFPAGSLKSFVENGLENIFVEKPKISENAGPRPKIKKEVELELAPLAPEPLKQIFKPKKKEKKKVASVPAPPKPKPKKSHFLLSSEARKEFALETVKVDMLKFKYDFMFSPKMLEYLENLTPKFATRKGLEEMKEYDSLGTRKGPVPLLFIKYLIEEQNHQGLFNLVDTLGAEFFVKNNIDDPEISEPYTYIGLKFEENSDFNWQILIKEEPNTSSRE